MPIFSGAIRDRFSRKKTIYTLDFISAGLYLLLAGLLFLTGCAAAPQPIRSTAHTTTHTMSASLCIPY